MSLRAWRQRDELGAGCSGMCPLLLDLRRSLKRHFERILTKILTEVSSEIKCSQTLSENRCQQHGKHIDQMVTLIIDRLHTGKSSQSICADTIELKIDPWAIAKLFLPRKKHMGSTCWSDLDVEGVISIMVNCNYFWSEKVLKEFEEMIELECTRTYKKHCYCGTKERLVGAISEIRLFMLEMDTGHSSKSYQGSNHGQSGIVSSAQNGSHLRSISCSFHLKTPGNSYVANSDHICPLQSKEISPEKSLVTTQLSSGVDVRAGKLHLLVMEKHTDLHVGLWLDYVKRFMEICRSYPIYYDSSTVRAFLTKPEDIEKLLHSVPEIEMDITVAMTYFNELITYGSPDNNRIWAKTILTSSLFEKISNIIKDTSKSLVRKVRLNDLLLGMDSRKMPELHKPLSLNSINRHNKKTRVVPARILCIDVITSPDIEYCIPVDEVTTAENSQLFHDHAQTSIIAQATPDTGEETSYNLYTSASRGPQTRGFERVSRYSLFGNTFDTTNTTESSRPTAFNQETRQSEDQRSTARESNNEQTSATRARYPNFESAASRRRSFDHWPRRFPLPEDLVKAGFFFTEQFDLVRCYQCGIGLKDFSDDDDPKKEHVKHAEYCEFLLGLFGRSGLDEYRETLRSQDPIINRRRQLDSLRNNPAVQFRGFRPRHPEYSNMEARLRTFDRWPPNLIQRPDELARAGLYYTGVDDHVRCYACDGGLRKWDPTDDPWIEHCRWFPACPFCIQEKGVEFIEMVQLSMDDPGNGATGGPFDLSEFFSQMTVDSSEFQKLIEEYRSTFEEMGFTPEIYKEATDELRQQGNLRPSIDDIIVIIGVINERKVQAQTENRQINRTTDDSTETIVDENQRLKSLLYCMKCRDNHVNALFLPCTHHRMCMKCANDVRECPVCHRSIDKKIKTYMS